MAKTTPDIQSVALTELAKALADPTPRLLLGTASVPGFFKGSAQATRAAAKLCEERQWLVPSEEWVGKGRTRKQKYRLSPAGVEAVLRHSETAVLLRGLATDLRKQSDTLQSMQDQIGQLLSHRRPLADVVAQLALRVEPPDVEAVLRRLQTPSPAAPPAAADWQEQVVRLAAEQRQRDRFQPATLPQLFAQLRQTRPELTLGQFHDGLRRLRDQGRIRLTPYTRALATIADAGAALFLDGEVMYYVELP